MAVMITQYKVHADSRRKSLEEEGRRALKAWPRSLLSYSK